MLKMTKNRIYDSESLQCTVWNKKRELLIFIFIPLDASFWFFVGEKRKKNRRLLATVFLMEVTYKQPICKHTSSSLIHFLRVLYVSMSRRTDGYQGDYAEC